ncbi:hypothetical protein AgCh_029903, partial [Apium graveolens]
GYNSKLSLIARQRINDMGKLKKFVRKKQRKGKASNTRKKRRNNRKKATADPKRWDGFNNSENVCKLPPPKPVSEDYLAAFSAKTMAALGVSFANSHSCYKPPYILSSQTGADLNSWDPFMKSEKDSESPSPKPVSEDYLAVFSAKIMAALGVSFANSHSCYKPPYILSSQTGADMKSWDPFMKSEKDSEFPSPKPVSEDYLAAFSAKTMAALGVSFANSHSCYKHPYTAAADPERLDAI